MNSFVGPFKAISPELYWKNKTNWNTHCLKTRRTHTDELNPDVTVAGKSLPWNWKRVINRDYLSFSFCHCVTKKCGNFTKMSTFVMKKIRMMITPSFGKISLFLSGETFCEVLYFPHIEDKFFDLQVFCYFLPRKKIIRFKPKEESTSFWFFSLQILKFFVKFCPYWSINHIHVPDETRNPCGNPTDYPFPVLCGQVHSQWSCHIWAWLICGAHAAFCFSAIWKNIKFQKCDKVSNKLLTFIVFGTFSSHPEPGTSTFTTEQSRSPSMPSVNDPGVALEASGAHWYQFVTEKKQI